MSRKNPYEDQSTHLVYLDHIADAFDCHPRTVLRAVTGNPTEYWTPAHNPRLRVTLICDTFQLSKGMFFNLLVGKEKVVPPAEAADYLEISVRTLRKRADYIPVIIGKGFLRFAMSDLKAWYAERKRLQIEKINKLF